MCDTLNAALRTQRRQTLTLKSKKMYYSVKLNVQEKSKKDKKVWLHCLRNPLAKYMCVNSVVLLHACADIVAALCGGIRMCELKFINSIYMSVRPSFKVFFVCYQINRITRKTNKASHTLQYGNVIWGHMKKVLRKNYNLWILTLPRQEPPQFRPRRRSAQKKCVSFVDLITCAVK